MQLTRTAKQILKKRYLLKDEDGNVIETPRDMLWRVAWHVAGAELLYDEDKTKMEQWAEKFFSLMDSQRFLPNSPTLMNAGKRNGQLSACFVLPVPDNLPGIFEAVKQAAIIHKSGGGTGFDFSDLRPAGDLVASTKGVSSGPVTFMKVFDAATETIKQGGARRGANMGILRVDHPDILEFIRCKNDNNALNNFNISVAITHAFMEAYEKGEKYALTHPRTLEVVGYLDAREVMKEIATSAWRNGEPGVVFIDTVNDFIPLDLRTRFGSIRSTNPCGEQPLWPYESCNLGSLNLSKYVVDGDFDYKSLGEDVEVAVRFLDNVIDVNCYPLPEIEEQTKLTRKIGLGVMGWADALIKMGVPYSSSRAIELAECVMSYIETVAYEYSALLGYQRGYALDLDRRNTTLTTIAPTGTISILAGCSSGIEPIFSYAYKRRIMDDEFFEIHPYVENELFPKLTEEERENVLTKALWGADLKDYAPFLENVNSLRFDHHIRMQAAFQQYTDNAVSKTINLPEDASVEEIKKAYVMAYKSKCKGITVYRDGSRESQVLVTNKTVEQPKPTGQKRERPAKLQGATYRMQTGCGPLYVTVNSDESGQPFEIFTTIGKAGGCASSQCEAIGRLASLSWRYGVAVEDVVEQLSRITCHRPFGFGDNRVLSCSDAVARAIAAHMGWGEMTNGSAKHNEPESEVCGACPECGDALEHTGGCVRCISCGYSECG